MHKIMTELNLLAYSCVRERAGVHHYSWDAHDLFSAAVLKVGQLRVALRWTTYGDCRGVIFGSIVQF